MGDRLLHNAVADHLAAILHAVNIGNILGDLLRAVDAFLNRDDLAEVILIGLAGLGVVGNLSGVGGADHLLNLEHLGAGDAGDEIGALFQLLVGGCQPRIQGRQRIPGHPDGVQNGLNGIALCGHIVADVGALIQAANHIVIVHHRGEQINAVHQLNIMDKADPLAGIQSVHIRGLDAFQISAQMVALGGDKAKASVHIDCGRLGNLIA